MLYGYVEKREDGCIVGTTMGCGCCSDEETLDAPKLREYISSLQQALTKAQKLLQEEWPMETGQS
jgi:hypothetical protein